MPDEKTVCMLDDVERREGHDRRRRALETAMELAFEIEDPDALEEVLANAIVLFDVSAVCVLIRHVAFLLRVACGHEEIIRSAGSLDEAREFLHLAVDRETEDEESLYRLPLIPRRRH